MIRSLLSVLSLAHAAYAYHMPALVARTAVHYGRAAPISMVQWDKVSAEAAWTKDAWEAMHLSSEGLHGCVAIPDKFVPDTNPDGTRDPSAGTRTVSRAHVVSSMVNMCIIHMLIRSLPACSRPHSPRAGPSTPKYPYASRSRPHLHPPRA